VYRLVLHWKGARLPLLVVEQEAHPFSGTQAIGAFAGGILARGRRYSLALGVPFYDNSYYHSPEPMRPV